MNLGICDFCSVRNKICRWEVLQAPGITSLFQAMDARPFEGRVVIERQSKKSMKMLAVQHWLQSYYVIKGSPVTIFAPVHKLAGTGQENAGRANYRARKKAAIALTHDWLRDNPQDPEIHAFFAKTKKKDDAADSALQALAFLNRSVTAAPLSTEPPRIVCRRPTLLQLETGKYSQANLKHIICKDWQCASLVSLNEFVSKDKKAAKAIKKHFKTAEQCWEKLKPAQTTESDLQP